MYIREALNIECKFRYYKMCYEGVNVSIENITH